MINLTHHKLHCFLTILFKKKSKLVLLKQWRWRKAFVWPYHTMQYLLFPLPIICQSEIQKHKTKSSAHIVSSYWSHWLLSQYSTNTSLIVLKFEYFCYSTHLTQLPWCSKLKCPFSLSNFFNSEFCGCSWLCNPLTSFSLWYNFFQSNWRWAFLKILLTCILLALYQRFSNFKNQVEIFFNVSICVFALIKSNVVHQYIKCIII
jgi:hypothetical protein